MGQTIFTLLTSKQARQRRVIATTLDQTLILGAPWF